MAEKLYLYLAKRDKTGFKLIATFPTNQSYPPTKVDDVAKLGLSENIVNEIKPIIYENRMRYDVWIQTAKDFKELKASLQYRGYKNLPIQMSPMYRQGTSIRNKSEPKPKQDVNLRNLQPKTTMLRRKSDQRRVT